MDFVFLLHAKCSVKKYLLKLGQIKRCWRLLLGPYVCFKKSENLKNFKFWFGYEHLKIKIKVYFFSEHSARGK
jgi:hypothetical protein